MANCKHLTTTTIADISSDLDIQSSYNLWNVIKEQMKKCNRTSYHVDKSVTKGNGMIEISVTVYYVSKLRQ